MSGLTEVILGGALGKQFGRKWKVAAESVPRALQIIEANREGLSAWMRMNAKKFDRYHVKVEKNDGSTLEVGERDLDMVIGAIKRITITPVIAGAGAGIRIVVGVVLMVASYWLGPYVFAMGASLALGGIVELLSPTPKLNHSGGSTSNNSSYYFDGPVNTVDQGVPVPLVYGRVLAGSQAISAKITIDQLM